MTNLEEKVENLEIKTKQEVTLQVSNLKEDIVNSLKNDINSVVDKRNRELEGRKRRELNLTIFNLKEHRNENGTENKRADEVDVRIISASLELENLSIVTSYRLGRKDDAKTRPLRIILDSKAQRKFLLKNARFIGIRIPETYQRVIIAKDLTPEQRNERREKIKNKKQQSERRQPASPMDARAAVTLPTRQFIYREPLHSNLPITQ